MRLATACATSKADRPLLPFALWMLVETSAAIIKERLVHERPTSSERPLAITLLAILAALGSPVLLFAAYIWINAVGVTGMSADVVEPLI